MTKNRLVIYLITPEEVDQLMRVLQPIHDSGSVKPYHTTRRSIKRELLALLRQVEAWQQKSEESE